MREFNVLGAYPQPQNPRYVGPKIRTIKNKIIASYRDKEYYDGDRNNGYGGFQYDGRWQKIAESMYKEYGLNENSAVLQIGSEKGFLLHDFHEKYPKIELMGLEMSDYAIDKSMSSIKKFVKKVDNYDRLFFEDSEFDFVIAIGVIYPLTLRDAISCLKEIQRVGKGKSFITLGSYRNEEEFKLFRYWTVLGSTILHKDEWVEVLKYTGYTGDYTFYTAETLNLVWKED